MSTQIKRSRGRPRQFDESMAINAAMKVFWQKGLSATSMDDLAAAMAMNKPSVYRAFGDKQALYRRSLERFGDAMKLAMSETLFSEGDVRIAFGAFFKSALGIYTQGEQPLGCLVMNTATCVAPINPEVQADVLSILKVVDDAFEQRLKEAQKKKQIAATIDCKKRARLFHSLLHTLSIRARAGESARQLRALISDGIEVLAT